MKSIRTRDDLAVNGARPAFEEPLHVGRPNIGSLEEFQRLTSRIFETRWLTNNGPLVQELEARIAGHLGVRNCIAICNGTIALEIAIRALGMEGEVIVPSYTFIATAHSLYWQGITPVFADIDPVTHNISPAAVRSAITPRTTGIIAVHLWGRPAPIVELGEIADEYGLQLMFDAAHAFGCSFGGSLIGGHGRCEVMSFHATKVFNTFEGGAITTNDDALAERIRLMRNFGFSGYDNVIYPGTNGKMPEINAAMGLANLDALPGFVDANRRNHRDYLAALAPIGSIRLLDYDSRDTPNFHYVIAEVSGPQELRDRIVEALQAENILARKYFWPGCHRMKPYRDLWPDAGKQLPNTEAVAASVIVLPSGPTLPPGAIETVASVIRCIAE